MNTYEKEDKTFNELKEEIEKGFFRRNNGFSITIEENGNIYTLLNARKWTVLKIYPNGKKEVYQYNDDSTMTCLMENDDILML